MVCIHIYRRIGFICQGYYAESQSAFVLDITTRADTND